MFRESSVAIASDARDEQNMAKNHELLKKNFFPHIYIIKITSFNLMLLFFKKKETKQ